MQQEFYSLPLALDKLMIGNPRIDERQKDPNLKEQRLYEHPKCSLQQSVHQNLHLIMTTGFGEFPADKDFGCSIWDNDFDNLTTAPKLKENIRQSVLQSIQQYEKRLGKVKVEVMINQEEMPEMNARMVKKRIEITVTGNLNVTNEKFSYRDSFFMGPLSY